MPEIGATLREARMRARIDISEIETETKIRAKYLRALENEEWDLLPGPTYVRSFLRTYAEALELDGKGLLEEYKLRHERPTDHDLMPIGSPRRTPPGRGRGRPPRGISPPMVVGLMVMLILAGLYVLGNSGDDGSEESTVAGPADTTTTRTTTARSSTSSRRRRPSSSGATSSSSKIVRLHVLATGAVFVCVEAAGGRRPINGATLGPQSRPKTLRSSRFRITLGNSNARLSIDGKQRTVPSVANGIGYEITKGKVKTLSASQRPTCT